MKKHVKLVSLLFLVIVLTALILAGCGSSPSEPVASSTPEDSSAKNVTLGVVYPLTGNAAKTGKEYVLAYKLAIDIINNKYDNLGDFPFAKTEGIPGLGGGRISIVEADHQGNPEIGATETERLITTKNVDIVMGSHHSAVTKTASVAAERLSIPFICPDSTAKALTERGLKWFFRVGPHDGTFVDDTIKFLDIYKDQVGIKKVAIVSEDTEYGMLITKLEEEAAKKAGYEVVEILTYPSQSANLSSEVIRIKKANPDAILHSSYVSDAILFMKTYKDMDVNPKVIIGQRAGFIAPELFSTLGKDAEYLVSTNVFSLDLAEHKPYLKTINDMYKASSGVDLTGDYARAFQGVFVVADALNRAGSVDKEAFRNALLETDIGPEWLIVPYAGVKFDENQQNTLATGIITQFIGDNYKTVWPTEYKSIEATIPVPSWKERNR